MASMHAHHARLKKHVEARLKFAKEHLEKPVDYWETIVCGNYTCRGERKDSQSSEFSNAVTLIVSGKPKPTVRVKPQSLVYIGDTVTLICELQQGTGWEFQWYKKPENSQQQNTEHPNILKVTAENAGETVYQCRARRINYKSKYYPTDLSDPVSITAKDGDVILESSVHPVTEGHPLTLHCLYRNTNPSNLRADFYKDGSVVQNQTTGQMIIHKVSKSDEGFYHCKHPERGASQRSWISVRRSVSISGSRPSGETVGVAVGLSLSFLFIILLILMILLWFYKMKIEKQQKSSQISEQNQRRSGAEDSQSGHNPLQTGADAQLGMNDVTYAEVQLKPMKKVKRAQSRVSRVSVYTDEATDIKAKPGILSCACFLFFFKLSDVKCFQFIDLNLDDA
ncbi:Fc receptor-like protein 5 [Silurus meridionalis]|nr:Fc receptor-like protein 5 [Silurus meridionalis]